MIDSIFPNQNSMIWEGTDLRQVFPFYSTEQIPVLVFMKILEVFSSNHVAKYILHEIIPDRANASPEEIRI